MLFFANWIILNKKIKKKFLEKFSPFWPSTFLTPRKKMKFFNFFFFNFDDFDFDKFQCSLYTLLFPSSSLVCLIVMYLENVGTKFIYFRFQFWWFWFWQISIFNNVGDLSCVLVIIGPPRSGKGTYKFMLVSPLVCPWHIFSAMALTIILIFCMKLGEHKWKKVTEPDFSKKCFDPLFWVKKGSKMVFLGLFWKNGSNIFVEML